MNNLTVAGKTPQIAGMIWMQGETDTYGGPNGGADWSAAYSANLTNLINTVRDKEKFGDFAVPDMPFVLGRITTFFGSADNNALVRNAQMTVPGLVGHATWIDTDDLTWAYDGQYGTQGQIDLGIRFANAFATPEPSIFVLAGTGLLALGGYWWRKRRAH
jgi:LPXTG-motif cell wall-anchored protein